MKVFSYLVLGAVNLGVGCVDQESESFVDETSIDAEPRSGCPVPLLPALVVSPGMSRTVTAGSPQTIVVPEGSYGSAECSRRTVEFKTTQRVEVSFPAVDNEAECEGTTVTATFFLDATGDGGWIREIHASNHGHWNNGRCDEPELWYQQPYPRTVRVVVSAQKQNCAYINGIPLCTTSYGEAVVATGRRI